MVTLVWRGNTQRMNLERDRSLIQSAKSNLPERVRSLSLCYTSTLWWVNEEQSVVIVPNQSQLWKQTFSWLLISLPHLLLLRLSSTSSVHLLFSCPLSSPVSDSTSCFLPLLPGFSFMSHTHMSATLLFREHWWRIVLIVSLQEASRIIRLIKSRGPEANNSRPATMSTHATHTNIHKSVSTLQIHYFHPWNPFLYCCMHVCFCAYVWLCQWTCKWIFTHNPLHVHLSWHEKSPSVSPLGNYFKGAMQDE